MPRVDLAVRRLVRAALQEDLGLAGDLSTRWFLPPGARLLGRIVARQRGVICGLELAREVFRQVSPRIRFFPRVRDGAKVRPGQAAAVLEGPREILTGERTALNFLQRLSGIATKTRAFADRLGGTRAKLLDTRKTVPGWRALEKYAVRCGGGLNHRMGLYDMVMLKDNHLAATGDLRGLVERFREGHPRVPVLVEVKTGRDLDRALAARPEIILLDNMDRARLRRAIRRVRSESPRALIEVSGGVSLSTIRGIAALGPDRISVGALTHSAPALDLSLELENA